MNDNFIEDNFLKDDHNEKELDDNKLNSLEDNDVDENNEVEILLDEKLLNILEKKIFDIFAESENLEYLESTLERAKLINVKIFEKEYEIKSDKPNLVHYLANRINEEAKSLKKINPYFNQGQFNWAVQTAFQLCVKHYQEEKKYNFFIIEVEKKLDYLISKIDKNLKSLS